MKSIIIYACTLACFISCQQLAAQQRTAAEAKAIAASEMAEHSCHQVSASRLQIVGDSHSSNSRNGLFIVNDTLHKSFVIVSADSRMKPVLGYCNNSTFDNRSLPEGLLYLLGQWQQQYEWVQTHEPQPASAPTATATDVAPLLASTWGQASPFNNLCPRGTPSGCVATAMSQIMYHYRYPDKGTGSWSYTSQSKKHRCSFDFGATAFDWQNMLPAYSRKGTEAQNHAVAQLMYACGVSVGMDYTPSGSGAYAPDVPYALINYFGYNPNTVFYYRPYYSATDWYGMLYSELTAQRPVLYCGSDTKAGGHAFIIDGCRSSDGKFHVNWGWESDYDGYYELEALDPGAYCFSTYQSMIARFCPETVCEHEDVFYAERFAAEGRFAIGSAVTFKLTEVYCYASSAQYVKPQAQFKGKLGIGLFDENKTFIRPLAERDIAPLNTYYGERSLTFKFVADASLLAHDGTFFIMPYAQGIDATAPTRIRTQAGATDGFKYVVQDGRYSEGGDDIGPLPDPVAQWAQDFEAPRLSASWQQTQIEGTGKWMHSTPLSTTALLPEPSSGKSYVYLDYSDIGVINATMTATRLSSEAISLYPDSTYTLMVDYRKHSAGTDAHDALTILAMNHSGTWLQIAQQQVTNSQEWQCLTVDVKGSECARLAFEGSVSRGSRLFIDNIRLVQQPSTATRGDVDGNGVVDIDDMNVVINVMLHKAEATPAADVNADGTVDIDDMNTIINIMLHKE